MDLGLNKNWHSLSAEEIFESLETGAGGLKEEEAEKRLEKFGPNEIPEKNGAKILNIIANQLKSPLIYILLIAGLVSLFLEDATDALIIFGAVVLNTAVGFSQEWKVSNILEELKKYVSHRTKVRRSGLIKLLDSKEIVAGDIIILRQGDKIPADARLIKASNFKANEAVLTGESLPVRKTPGMLEESTAVADRTNMVFAGTLAEEGLGEAVVAATGVSTEFGKIASFIKKESGKDVTPLQLKLKSLAKTLGILFLSLSAVLFLVGVVSGIDVLSMFLTAVAVAVAAIPESLPIALSVTLAVGAKKVLSKKGLIKKIVAAEALGSTTLIAADKTATLTEGKMYITKLVDAEGKEIPRSDFWNAVEAENDSLFSLKLLALLSDAFIENPSEPKEQWKIAGRPLDKAIMLTALDLGLSKEVFEAEMPRIHESPFDAKKRYSVTLNKFSQDKNLMTFFGAPEVIIGFSNLGEQERKSINEKVSSLASEGFKVLALGFKHVPVSVKGIDHISPKEIQFQALVAFSDPIREEVKESIAIAKLAGLKTVMVTGDHVLTAEYVAKELGILIQKERVISGKDLPDDLGNMIGKYDVFARVTPDQKVKIVDAFKKKGENVAMIGDGVNDAPALLRADIGVAVGSGTDVAKEASELVLLNDSFSIIVEAIRQGRIILDNIKKTVIFLLSGAFTEIILISGSVFFGLPLALLPAQILWVNIIEDGLPSVALAFEKEKGNVMARKADKAGRIFTREMKLLIAMFAVVADLVLFSLFYFLLARGGDVDYARTMIFVGLGITSLFYIFSVRSLEVPIWKINFFSNRFLIISVLVGLALYAASIYSGLFNKLLGTVPLGVRDWLILAALGVFNIFLIEAGKLVFFRKTPKP